MTAGNIHSYLKDNKGKIYTCLLALVIVTLFFKKENINSISIILLTVFWLLDIGKNGITLLKTLTKHKLLLLNVVFFLALVYGLLISENQSYAIKVLQRNLPFLVFPLVFLRLKSVSVNIKVVKLSLIISAFIASVYCEIVNIKQWYWFNSFPAYDFSVYDYFTHHWFTYGVLTRGLDFQPSFFALYILVAKIFILEYILFYKNKKRTHFVISIVLLLYFIFFMFHLSSRIGLVLLFGVLGYYFFKLKIKTQYKATILLGSIVLLAFILVNSRFMERLKELQVTLQEEAVDKGDNNINAKRIRIYALQAFADQEPVHFLFGRGTGDAQKYLDAFYEKKIVDNPEAVKHQKKWKLKGTHYHNQFIQTNVETGIIGLAALILIFFMSLKKGLKHKSREHVLFIVICILFFLTDSVLMRQKGIVFFTFFNIFFIVNHYKNEATLQVN